MLMGGTRTSPDKGLHKPPGLPALQTLMVAHGEKSHGNLRDRPVLNSSKRVHLRFVGDGSGTTNSSTVYNFCAVPNR